jgi:molybdate transport system ATP-binding protein
MIQVSLKKKLNAAQGKMHLDVDVEIGTGEIVALYGASGAGKTSILRMLSGLTLPDNGLISVEGQTWFDTSKKINLRPQQRNVGIVFQDYALFPNMTVKENLMFALEKKLSTAIVDELLELMELTKLHNVKPELLSGGQQQRVALARALVRKPKLLLLDEPMSALDTTLRLKIQDYIIRVHEQFHLTTILVSHDILEVVRLSKKVFVIDHGKLIQQGPPGEILPLQALKQMIGKLPDQKII